VRDSARWIVVLSAAALFFVGLGRPTYGVADVTRYAQMVLEMRHEQTLVPTLDGRAYYEAAPLAAWGPYFVSRIAGGSRPRPCASSRRSPRSSACSCVSRWRLASPCAPG